MDNLLLVNSCHSLPADFSPRLKEVSLKTEFQCGKKLLEKNTARACEKMLESALNDGIEIKLLSGFRSREYQRRLWESCVNEYISGGLGESEAEYLTARYLARPGTSEHETGLACDFCSPDWDDTQDDFDKTEQGEWLMKSCFKFGFILRYPKGKEHITGCAYEPWHFRFVGDCAEYIMKNGLTLEEFLSLR